MGPFSFSLGTKSLSHTISKYKCFGIQWNCVSLFEKKKKVWGVLNFKPSDFWKESCM